MKTITLEFKDSDDLKSFEKYMALAKAKEGTVTGLYCGLMCSALKRSEVVQSAAPELLEALETLLDCSPCQNGCDPSDMTCASNLARAAIAKAKGQS